MPKPTPRTGRITLRGQRVQTWITSNLAEYWFADAVRESRDEKSDWHARRREIIFAVCCAESYIVEWTRDLVKNPVELAKYFPPNARRGARQKWQEIPKQLYDNGVVTGKPDLGRGVWQEWKELVDLRDWLVHAKPSLPYTGNPGADEPRATRGELDQISAGWAVGVVSSLIRDLHLHCGPAPPGWLDASP